MIDYFILNDALDFYQTKGFKYIDVPWTVSEDIVQMTMQNAKSYSENEYFGKFLVGSAEQSFLSLAANGNLKQNTRYCAITPCFRSDEIDHLHQQYFMKVELFQQANFNPRNQCLDICDSFISFASEFFSMYNDNEIVATHEQFGDYTHDIQINGVEVGSYGIRQFNSTTWVYGTGVAEPRLSTVLSDI